MTNSLSFSPRLFPVPPALSTIGPSTLLPAHRPPRRPTLPPARSLRVVPAEDRVGQGMLIGLLAVTLPAAAYTLLQAWHLVGGDTLTRAVHAFVP